MNWIKTGRKVSSEGTTTIYQSEEFTIESRKRHIPHANRSGTWDYTSYWLLKDGKEIKEFWSLRDAKKYAEEASES